MRSTSISSFIQKSILHWEVNPETTFSPTTNFTHTEQIPQMNSIFPAEIRMILCKFQVKL